VLLDLVVEVSKPLSVVVDGEVRNGPDDLA
jgi:hypothetical protein